MVTERCFELVRGLGRQVSRLGLRFRGDRRGAVAVQALVLLPLILIGMVSASFLWQTLTIRRSLHYGTAEATRFLSLYPVDTDDPYDWEAVARKFIEAEMRNNPFVDPLRINDINPRVTIQLLNSYDCGDAFTLDTEWDLFAAVGDSGLGGLPDAKQFTLKEHREGEVVCEP